MLFPLTWIVIIAALFSVTALLTSLIKTLTFRNDPAHAVYRSSGIGGMIYAFGRGMMPWEKESTKKHLISYLAGIIYHVSIFIAFIYLALLVFLVPVSEYLLLVCSVIFLIGLCCGIGLLLKRAISPLVRRLSNPDDFASNIIVDLFLLCALVTALDPSSKPLFFLMAIVLFIYIPFGKIRHCFFFFYVRTLFGLFYGRRGVLPPKLNISQE